APARSAVRASSILCLVSFLPAPATMGARSPTASITERRMRSFSSSLVVADSPVVLLTKMPSLRVSSSRHVAMRSTTSPSTSPWSSMGVIIAVNVWPKGAFAVVLPTMLQTVPRKLDRARQPPRLGRSVARSDPHEDGRSVVVLADEQAQEPAHDRHDDGSPERRPEAVDLEGDAQHPSQPGGEPQQKSVDDESDKPQGDVVEDAADRLDDRFDDSVDDTEQCSDTEVGGDRGDRGVGGHLDP